LVALDEAHKAMPSWYNVVARRKLGRGDDWLWFQLQVVKSGASYGSDTIVTGAVPVGFVTRGPNKGAPKWPSVSESERVIVTAAEVRAAREAWERETGKCAECAGTGQRNSGFSVKDGRTYRACEACAATGRAECAP
jgi:hypothetical protein